MMTQIAGKMHDESRLPNTLSQMATYYRRSGLDFDTFCDTLDTVVEQTLAANASITKVHADSTDARPKTNKMGVYVRNHSGHESPLPRTIGPDARCGQSCYPQ